MAVKIKVVFSRKKFDVVPYEIASMNEEFLHKLFEDVFLR